MNSQEESQIILPAGLLVAVDEAEVETVVLAVELAESVPVVEAELASVDVADVLAEVVAVDDAVALMLVD